MIQGFVQTNRIQMSSRGDSQARLTSLAPPASATEPQTLIHFQFARGAILEASWFSVKAPTVVVWLELMEVPQVTG